MASGGNYYHQPQIDIPPTQQPIWKRMPHSYNRISSLGKNSEWPCSAKAAISEPNIVSKAVGSMTGQAEIIFNLGNKRVKIGDKTCQAVQNLPKCVGYSLREKS